MRSGGEPCHYVMHTQLMFPVVWTGNAENQKGQGEAAELPQLSL